MNMGAGYVCIRLLLPDSRHSVYPPIADIERIFVTI